MAHDVFVCYSSEDRTTADAVCATLESRKTRCWIAPRDVPAGAAWAGTLTDAIQGSAVFILVFSDGANRSAQVLREVTEAVDKGIPIIPFRIEAIEPSRDLGYYLKPIHWLDALTPPLERHLEELARRVEALLSAGRQAHRPPVVEPSAAERQAKVGTSTATRIELSRNGLPWMLVAAMGALLVLIFGAILLTRGLWWTPTGQQTAAPTAMQAATSENTPISAPTDRQPTLVPPTDSMTTRLATPATATGPYVEPTATTSAVGTPLLAGERVTYLPDKQVAQFFAPGSNPVALAIVTDTIWVADDQQRILTELDQSGVPLASYHITPTQQIRGLAWDGQSFYLLQNAFPGHEIWRLDRMGGSAGEAPMQVPPLNCVLTGLAWDAGHRLLWTGCEEMALGFDPQGHLKVTLPTGVLAWIDSLAWIADGICVIGPHNDWNCTDIIGHRLVSGRMPSDGGESLAWDNRGSIWVLRTFEKDITQYSVQQVPLEQTTPAGVADKRSLPLPRPNIQPGENFDTAVARVINRLPGTVSLAFGDRSVVLRPGETWAESLSGEYDVYATTNQPVSLRFSGKEILVPGYEFTWILAAPQ